MFKFIHAADIHLDSPLRGLARYEGAPAAELRAATHHARLVALAEDAVDGGVLHVHSLGQMPHV